MKVILLTLTLLFFSLAGEACTLCNSKTATDVRAIVYGDDFVKNILFTIIPFLVFTVIILSIYNWRVSDNILKLNDKQ